MPIHKVLGIVLLILWASIAYGQVPKVKPSDLNAAIINHVKSEAFKDSLAIYTCNIQIRVDKSTKYTPRLSSSNKELFDSMNLTALLKNADYKQLMKDGRRSTFIIPVSITVLDSKQNEKTIPLSLMDIKIDNLFFYHSKEGNGSSVIYLTPVILTIDKRVYH